MLPMLAKHLTLLQLLVCSTAGSTPAPPLDLRTEMLNAPAMGIDNAEPQLMWTLAAAGRGVVSTGYQVQLGLAAASWNASVAPLWDTGKRLHCHGVPPGVLCVPESHTLYSGPPLLAATSYQWRVRWWSNATAASSTTPSSWSASAVFVTGLFAPEDWRDAAFLTCDRAPPPPPPASCELAKVLGCFDDSKTAGLGFTYQAVVHDKTTFEVCAGACDRLAAQQQQQGGTQQAEQGNTYENSEATKFDVAAIDAGNHCFCGTTAALTALHARGRPAAECGASSCHANTSETGCGGKGRMVAYSYKNCKPASATPPPPPLPSQESPQRLPEWPVVGPPQCRYLRSEFSLPAAPVRVTAFVAAMGYVELWVNGKQAGGECGAGAGLEPV